MEIVRFLAKIGLAPLQNPGTNQSRLDPVAGIDQGLSYLVSTRSIKLKMRNGFLRSRFRAVVAEPLSFGNSPRDVESCRGVPCPRPELESSDSHRPASVSVGSQLRKFIRLWALSHARRSSFISRELLDCL